MSLYARAGHLSIDRRHERAVGRVVESDTKHCCHCNALIVLTAVREGALTRKHYRGSWCATCGALRCERRACQLCRPFMRAVEAKHARDRLHAALGLQGA